MRRVLVEILSRRLSLPGLPQCSGRCEDELIIARPAPINMVLLGFTSNDPNCLKSSKPTPGPDYLGYWHPRHFHR
jgi:hypothetical protein